MQKLNENSYTSNDYFYFNEITKNWKVESSDLALRKFLIFLSDDLRNKSYIKGSREEFNKINRIAFIDYFDMPLLLSQRIYNFISNESKSLKSVKKFKEPSFQIEEFILGFEALLVPTFDQLASAAFSIYDFDEDGVISYSDVKLVMTSLINYKEKQKTNMTLTLKQEIDPESVNVVLNNLFIESPTLDFESFKTAAKKKCSDILIAVIFFILKITQLFDDAILSDSNDKEKENESPYIYLEHFHKKSKVVNINVKMVKLKFFGLEVASRPVAQTLKELHSVTPEFIKPNIAKYSGLFKSSNQTSSTVTNSTNKTNLNSNERRNSIQTSLSIFQKMNLILPNIGKSANAIENLKESIDRESARTRDKSVNTPNSIKHMSKEKLKSLLKSGSLSLERQSELKLQEKIFMRKKGEILSEIQTNKLYQAKKNEILFYGYLYTFRCANKNRLKKWFFMLRRDRFLIFNDFKMTQAIGIVSLHNCFLKYDNNPVTIGEKIYFGLYIYHNISNEVFFCEEKEEHVTWLKTLRDVLRESDTISNYFLIRVLDQSKLNTLHLGKLKEDEKLKQVAIKIIRKSLLDSIDLELIRNETEVLKLNKHRNIISLISAFENYEYCYIVTEYIEGSMCLVDFMRKNNYNIPEVKTKIIIGRIFDALRFLHESGVMCRNIKTENILLTESLDLKIINFRFSRFLGEGQFIENEPYGAMSYAAPEVIMNVKYNKSADVFSFGILCYTILTGKMPFNGESDEEIARSIIKCEYNYKNCREIKDVYKSFLEKIILKNPESRLSFEELRKYPIFS